MLRWPELHRPEPIPPPWLDVAAILFALALIAACGLIPA